LEDWTINHKLNKRRNFNMLWLRKSKKGFTLIELMVVVAIIGVLSLLGLRLYTGQQRRAKDAIAIANAATIHTLIQANLVDKSYPMASEATVISDAVVTATNTANTANLRNPYDSTPATVVVAAATVDIPGTASGAAAAGLTIGVVYEWVYAADKIHVRAVGEGTAGGPVWVGNLLTALK
jgi:prepilin-type N-terminal cleavage/methylation domain-containing protein